MRDGKPRGVKGIKKLATESRLRGSAKRQAPIRACARRNEHDGLILTRIGLKAPTLGIDTRTGTPLGPARSWRTRAAPFGLGTNRTRKDGLGIESVENQGSFPRHGAPHEEWIFLAAPFRGSFPLAGSVGMSQALPGLSFARYP